MNYLAIAVAAFAAWIVGAVWYGALGKQWMAAQDWPPEKIEACKKQKMPVGPMIVAFVAELFMASGLSWVMVHRGGLTVQNGLLCGGSAWLFFVVSTMAVNNAFQQRKILLTVIDGGAWLFAFLAQGAVLGAFGG